MIRTFNIFLPDSMHATVQITGPHEAVVYAVSRIYGIAAEARYDYELGLWFIVDSEQAADYPAFMAEEIVLSEFAPDSIAVQP